MSSSRPIRWVVSVLVMGAVLAIGLGSVSAAPQARALRAPAVQRQVPTTAPPIRWSPTTWTQSLAPGQSVTTTVSFTSSLEFEGTAVHVQTGNWPLLVTVQPIPTSIKANVPVTVTFNVTLAPDAVGARFSATIAVMSSGIVVGAVLPLNVTNSASAPTIDWSLNPITATLAPGGTASLTDVLTPTAVLNNPIAHATHVGWPLMVATGGLPKVVDAGKTATLAFTVTLASDAPHGRFTAIVNVCVNGIAFAKPLTILVTNETPLPVVRWTPTLITGTVAYTKSLSVTASFTATAMLELPSWRIVSPAPGVTITLSPLPASVPPNQTVNVKLTISIASTVKRVGGDIYVVMDGAELLGPLAYRPTVS